MDISWVEFALGFVIGAFIAALPDILAKLRLGIPRMIDRIKGYRW